MLADLPTVVARKLVNDESVLIIREVETAEDAVTAAADGANLVLVQVGGGHWAVLL